MATERRQVEVPWHMYRQFPADFSRWSEAATGFAGWHAEPRPLDLDRTCLALMHLPDTGLSADTEWGPDCPNPDALGTVEWVPRTMELVAFRLPRLVTAARAARLLVAHVGVGGPPHNSGPVWERSVSEAGEPPASDNEAIPLDEERWARHRRDVFDLPRQERADVAEHVPSLPGCLLPCEGDIVAQHAWQLHRLLRNRGVDHLVYCGWALNWCLWFSPCGMLDMQRRGYMCSAVRGGCVAIENAESAVGELNLAYAYWKTSTMFGYVFDLHELTSALRGAAANASKV